MIVAFNGFISYSHAADGRLAPAVQRGLHHLARPWNRRRALWIFRDQTGLSVTPALWSSIQRALNDSDYFVLLASPEAARSTWVNREIEHWVAVKSADRILPVVTDGEWRWDPVARDFDATSTAVPPALRGVFAEEPLHLDLRWARDDQQLSLRHTRFRDAIAQLAAPMHGVSKDDLEGEDVRQQRRSGRVRLAVLSLLTLLTLLASVTGVFALRNAAEANASAIEARRQQQEASVQRGSAAKFAGEAQRQQALAEEQEARAREQQAQAQDAAAEARTQLDRADRAATRAGAQERLADRQSALARESATETRRQQQRAEEQAQIAREQQRLAGEASAESREQRRIARQQQRLAQQAGAEARQQQKIAQQQQRLAQQAGAEARRQRQIAADQRKLADDAKADAEREKANAGRQQRIAISRRLVNEAKVTLADDPQQALRLGVAAQKIHPEAETRREVVSLITSTRHAGALGDVAAVEHGPGDLLVTVDAAGVVSLWDTAERAEPVRLATIGEPGTLNNRISLTRDGKFLVVVRDGIAVLWDITEPTRPVLATTLPGDRRYQSAVFSPDGRLLVTGDRTGPDGYATLWDVTDRGRPKNLSTLQGSTTSGDDFAFSADGRTLVDGNGDTHIWDVTDPAGPVARATIWATGPIFSLALSPGGPLLALGNGLGELALYDLTDTAEPVRTATVRSDDNLMLSLAFSADGRILASGDSGGRTTLWQVDAYPREVGRFPGTGGIESLTFSPDGRTLVTADSADAAVLWNTTDFAAPRPLAGFAAHTDRLLATSYAADGRSMTTVGADGKAVGWDVTDRQRPVRRFAVAVPGLGWFGAAAISADGHTVAGSGPTAVVTLTDIRDPAKPSTRQLRSVIVQPTTLSFSPDGHTFAVGGDGRLELWDLAGPAPRRVTTLTFTNSSVGAVTFSPDGHTMAVTAVQTVSLWDLTNRAAPRQLSVLAGHGNTVLAVRFSPDGKTVLTGSYDHTAILWDVTDPARPGRLTTLTGHTYKVGAVAFSPDGDTVATAEDGSWVILWDVSRRTSPRRLARVPLDQYHSPVDLVFSADGSTLEVGTSYGWDGYVALFDLTDLSRLRADPAPFGCTITGRGLTPPEWARAVPELPYQDTCSTR